MLPFLVFFGLYGLIHILFLNSLLHDPKRS
jgi:hypothetical protein